MHNIITEHKLEPMRMKANGVTADLLKSRI